MNKSSTNFNTSVSSNHVRGKNLKIDRQDSSVIKLCDLHVYKVPPDLWREAYNNILNNAVTETVSVGIIRVPPETRLLEIREEIVQQLGMASEDLLPRDYVFLRSVGRSLTTLRLKQEYQLKAKHFLPPVAYAPELFILEATPEIREALAGSHASSQSPPLSRQLSPRSYPYHGTFGDPDSERRNRPYYGTSPLGIKPKTLPQIGNDPYRGRDGKPLSNADPYNHNLSSPSPRSGNSPNNDPPNHHGYKNSPKHNRQPQNLENRQFHNSDQPGSEWDEQPESKQNTKKHASPIKRSSPPSAEKGRNHRIDDDSGVAGLSPVDDYDNIFRKARDLQKHLDSDRLNFDETEEEKRRRLEDLESRDLIDRERWNADQEERKRLAKEDRMKEMERKKEKEDDERRQKEDEERKKQQQEEEKRRKEKDTRRDEEKKKNKIEEEKNRKEEEKRKREEDEKRRLEDEKNKFDEEKRKFDKEKRKQNEEMKKREEDKQRDLERKEKEQNERRKKEDLEKQKRENEEKKHREEKEREKDEENRKKLKEHIPSPEIIRDTESARQRRRDEKNQLLKELEEAKQARQDQEKIREELVRKAKQMQHKTTNRRNEARDMWKKKYFEEKKKTAPLEENSNRLRNELEALHKRLVNQLEGLDPKERHLRITDPRPSEKNNYVIQSTKLQHEIEDLQRRVENARMKLTAEMKLRNQAQGELRALRAELTQRTQSIELTRQHQLASLNSPQMSGKENSSTSENIKPHSNKSKSYLEEL